MKCFFTWCPRLGSASRGVFEVGRITLTKRELLNSPLPIGQVERYTKHHPFLSPSSLGRAALCPGSVRLTWRLRGGLGIGTEMAGEAAEEGTQLHHAIVEPITRKGLDDEQLEILHQCDRILDKYEGARLEQPLTLEKNGETILWGTADVVVVVGELVTVIDWKFGRKKPRDINLAAQGYAYLAMAMQEYDVQTGVFSVFAPRVSDEVWSTGTLTRKKVFQSLEQLLEKVDTNPYFEPSEAACEYCPCVGFCEAQVEAIELVSKAQHEVSPAQIIRAVGLAKIAKKWAATVEERVKGALRDGAAIPNLQLKTSRGNRKFRDDSGPFAIFDALDLTAAEFEPACSVSVKKCEDAYVAKHEGEHKKVECREMFEADAAALLTRGKDKETLIVED